MEPFQGSQFFPNRQPRAALRLPWAMGLNRFAVGPIQSDRDENGPIVRACFPSFGAKFLATQMQGAGPRFRTASEMARQHQGIVRREASGCQLVSPDGKDAGSSGFGCEVVILSAAKDLRCP